MSGKYDRDTAEALLRFRMDQRDGTIRQPLARSGPILNRLAQGQALAVFEGTAIPYKLATLAEPGAIEGGIAELLSAERKVALHGGDEGLHPGLGHCPRRRDQGGDDQRPRPIIQTPRRL